MSAIFERVDYSSRLLGHLYIDVPYDQSNETYIKIEKYLENPDGSMHFNGVKFAYLPLELAMENSEQDDPGFWDDI
jgi:hypothetical protein